ncbi:uncharacterized protein LOC123690347 [Pieris rapae]|uniref:uncharacterized protein LOC123690347 n=1 Tax=Pieris rapae TaxID=64459 RepID=UPI001E279DE5|nr:uncharacterized protein LOC123690347 [Pieris rapae]
MIFMYITLLIIYNPILGIENAEYIHTITSSPGIYFDPHGTAKIINDHIHIVIPIDISFAPTHIDNIKNAFGTIRYLCQQSQSFNHFECHNLIQPLDSLFKDIIRDFQSISHLTTSKSKRSAWFAGIGTVFKHIFGTLDEDDAHRYNKAIAKMQQTDKDLNSNLKQSIYISKSAITNFNASMNELNKNQILLNDVLDKLSLSVKNVSEVINSVKFQTNLDEILSVLQASLLTLSFKIEDIVNSVLFSKSNTIHPSIITPKQLYVDLVSNIKDVSRLKDFPVELNLDNINILMNLAKIISYVIDNCLVFVIKIPLVNVETYNLYKVIPIPVPHNPTSPNSFALITATKSFIGISEDKKLYFNFDNIDSCNLIIGHQYICNPLNTLSVVNYPICETEIITKAIEKLPKSCTTKFIFGKVDIWHKLNNNKWFYVESNDEKLNIKCNHRTIEIVISGTGILSLTPGCTAFCKENRFEAKNVYEITVSPVVSNFNIINDSCCNLMEFSKVNINISTHQLRHVNLDSLNLIHDLPIKPIDDNLDVFLNDSSDYVSFSFSVISFIIILSIALIILVKANKCVFRNKDIENPDNISSTSEAPHPQPRLRME